MICWKLKDDFALLMLLMLLLLLFFFFFFSSCFLLLSSFVLLSSSFFFCFLFASGKMSEGSITYSFKFDKQTEFLKACRSLNITGGIFLGLGSLFLVAEALDKKHVVLEYDARIVQSDGVAFSRETGLPLEFNIVYEKVSQQGLRWTAKAHKNDVTEVGRLVRVCEYVDGSRKVKQGKVWPVALAFSVIGAGLLYMGIKGKVPEFMYWPPVF